MIWYDIIWINMRNDDDADADAVRPRQFTSKQQQQHKTHMLLTSYYSN